ncbi:MAG: methyltransferase domain-containing protein [Luteitalea sp.]|nr:methyltransferase domain-containing protein [Luteitalea sp.]
MAGPSSQLRAFTDRLVGWTRRGAIAARNGNDPWASSAAPRVQTQALTRFLACLSSREAPVLLDLGPVVGSNVAFFGEQLGCKIFVEDIHEDLDRFARSGTGEDIPRFLARRFNRPSESIDGILCWDLFDHLDKRAADALARELARLLKPGGALLAFFATTRDATSAYSKFIVVDDRTLHHNSYTAAPRDRHVLASRDIDRLFDGLNVSHSCLLRTRMREMLFRKRLPLDATAKAPSPVRRQRPVNGRPAPASASLNLAVHRANAGLRPTSSNGTPAVNGVEPRRGASRPLPLKAKPEKDSLRPRQTKVRGSR